MEENLFCQARLLSKAFVIIGASQPYPKDSSALSGTGPLDSQCLSALHFNRLSFPHLNRILVTIPLQNPREFLVRIKRRQPV